VLKKFDGFTSLNEDVLLTEALNNPKEYYMTDDTVLPGKMYGAFSVNGGTYIISLEASKDKGVYLLEVGKTGSKGGKTFWWKFHDGKDILPVLATTMDFLQNAYTMLPMLKGIAVQFGWGASEQINKATKLAQKMIKRSFIKTLKIVPVEQPPVTKDDKWTYQKKRFIFIAGKEMTPASLSTLFSSGTFKKYKQSKGSVSADAIGKLTTKTAKKQTNTIAPSKKYTFGQYDLDVPSDTELLDKLAVTKVTGEVEKYIEKQSNVDKELSELSKQVFEPADMSSIGAFANVLRTTPEFSKMANSLRVNGFDVKKVNFDNLQYVYSQMSDLNKQIVDTMAAFGSLSDANLGNIKGATGQIWIDILKYMAEPSGVVDEKHMIAIISYRNAKKKAAKKDATEVSKTSEVKKKPKLDIDMTEFKSTMPGTGTSEVKIEGNFFVESSEYDIGTIRQHLQSQGGLDYYSAIENLPKSVYKNVVHYSGPGYSSFNDPLRKIVSKLFRKEPLTKSEIDELTSGTKRIAKMARIFEKLKPLPESMYVYRSTMVPYEMRKAIVPGYEYVDPAFTSASLRTDVTIGGKDRMRIFLPKGSKIIPILEHSQHGPEQEIILPPTSIIKVVEAEVRKGDDFNEERIFFQGVYTGFAYKSIVEKLKKGLTEAVESRRILLSLQRMISMSEEKKEDGYDPEGKFGGTYDWNLATLITKAIEDGDIEIDVPVDPSKED
tara:strand:+ start:599 stop:2752 length:2154 start_codon:yes stop_codon:yes gene_type:complete